MRRLFLFSALMTAAPAAAQDAPYLDDRSDPAALVNSLYNAINRGEYGRAYSYFATPPADSIDAYAAGYERTKHVDVIVGTPSEEGAAGSVFYQLPVAIAAYDDNDARTVFAGCYTLRLANPAIQADGFTPLQIESGALAPSDAEPEDALPGRCGDGADLPPHDAALDAARAMYRADFANECMTFEGYGGPEAMEPETFEFSHRYSFESADDPERKVRLFRFVCGAGAYNQTHVHYLADDEGKISQVQFSAPELDIRYVDDDRDDQVESVTVVGFQARPQIVNSDFDPATLTMSEHSLWRGVGDAASTSRWIFRNGAFSLVFHEVDASYDGEINPETMIDYESTP